MTTKNTKEIINKTEFYHSVEINDYKIKGFYNWEPYIDLITNLIDFNKKIAVIFGVFSKTARWIWQKSILTILAYIR